MGGGGEGETRGGGDKGEGEAGEEISPCLLVSLSPCLLVSLSPSHEANVYTICQRTLVAYTTKKFNRPTKNTKANQTPEPIQSSFLDSFQFCGVA